MSEQREILFRGKRKDNDEWVYGNYNAQTQDIVVLTLEAEEDTPDGYIYDYFRIDPSTVGQYTGLKDKNGRRIFEGDFISCDDIRGGYDPSILPFLIRWDMGFTARPINYHNCSWPNLDEKTMSHFEVIGNIHDTPELLEAKHGN